jgi:hypothetical protein
MDDSNLHLFGFVEEVFFGRAVIEPEKELMLVCEVGAAP